MMAGAKAQKPKARAKARRRGVALFWIITLIAATGGLFAVTNEAEKAAEEKQERDRREQLRTDNIATALNDYALDRADISIPLPSRNATPIPRLLLLPCPDNLGDSMVVDGIQDATCGQPTSATLATLAILDSGSRLGLLPWNGTFTLSRFDPGLGYPFADGTGNNFWYAVARNVAPATPAHRTRPLNLHHLANAPTDGWLNVSKLSNPTVRADNLSKVAAVIIAPGSNRTGRIPPSPVTLSSIDGATRAAGALDTIETRSGGFSFTHDNNNNDNRFVDAPRAGDFDDRVEYIAAEEWWQEGGDFVRRYEQKVGITHIHNAPAPGSPLDKVRQMIIGYHSLLNYYPQPAKNAVTVVNTPGDRVASRYHSGADTITVFTKPLLASVTTTTYLLMSNYGIHATLTSQVIMPVVGQMTVFVNTTSTLDVSPFPNCIPIPTPGCPDEILVNPGGLTVIGGMTITATITSTVNGGTLRTSGRRINVDDLPLTIGEIAPNGVYIEVVFNTNPAQNRLSGVIYRGTNPLLGSVSFDRSRSPDIMTLTLIASDRRLRHVAVADITNYTPGAAITILAAQPITATISSNASIVIDDMSILTSIRGTIAGATLAITCGDPPGGGAGVTLRPGNTPFTANVAEGWDGFNCGSGITITTTSPTLTVCCLNGAAAERDTVTVGDPVTIAQYARYIIGAPEDLFTLSVSVHNTTVRFATLTVTVNTRTTESRSPSGNGNYHLALPCGNNRIYPASGPCQSVTFNGAIARSYATVWTQATYTRFGVAPAGGFFSPASGPGAPILTMSRSPFFVNTTIPNGMAIYNEVFAGSPVSIIPLPPTPLVGQALASTVHVYEVFDENCDIRGGGCSGITDNRIRFVRSRGDRGDGSVAGGRTWLGGARQDFIVTIGGSPMTANGWITGQNHEVTIANGEYVGLFPVTGTIVPPLTVKELVSVSPGTTIPAGHVIALRSNTTLTLFQRSPLVPLPETEITVGWLPVSAPAEDVNPDNYTLLAGATAVFLSPTRLTNTAMSLVLAPEDTIFLPGGFVVTNTNPTLAGNIIANTNPGDSQTMITGSEIDAVSFAKRTHARSFALFVLADAVGTGGNIAIEAPALIYPGGSTVSQLRTIYPPVLNKHAYYEPNITDTRLTLNIARQEWVDPASVSRRTVDTDIPADMQDTAGEFLSITIRHGGTDDTDRPVLVPTLSAMTYELAGANNIYDRRRAAFNAFIEDHPMHYVVSGDCLYSGYDCGSNGIVVEVEEGATIALPDNYLLTSHPVAVTAVSTFVYANDANRTRYAIELFDRGVARLTPSVTAITIGAESGIANLFERERVRQVFVNGTLNAAATLTSIINARDSRPSRMFLSNGTRNIEVLLQEGQVIRNGEFFQIDAGTPMIARSPGVEIVGVGALLAFSPAPVTRAECGNQQADASGIPSLGTPLSTGEIVVDQTNVEDAEMTDLCAWLDTAENNDGDNRYVIKADTGNTFPLSQSNDYFIFFGGRPNL